MSKRPFTNLVCPLCGEKMPVGKRARVTVVWEKLEGSVVKQQFSRSKMVCGGCAEKITEKLGIESPEGIF